MNPYEPPQSDSRPEVASPGPAEIIAAIIAALALGSLVLCVCVLFAVVIGTWVGLFVVFVEFNRTIDQPRNLMQSSIIGFCGLVGITATVFGLRRTSRETRREQEQPSESVRPRR